MFDSRVHIHGTGMKLNLYKAVQITCRHVAAGGKPLVESYKPLSALLHTERHLYRRRGLDLRALDDRRVLILTLGHNVQAVTFGVSNETRRQ